MRWLRFTSLVLVTAILQAGFLDRIALGLVNAKPDLLLVLLVFFALYGIPRSKVDSSGGYCFDISPAIITSFALGFAADIILVGSPMGAHSLAFGVVGTLLAYLHRFIVIRKMPSQALMTFITGLCVGLLVTGLSRFKAEQTFNFTLILWRSVYSAVVAPFLFLPVAWWMRIRTHRFRRY